MDCRKLSARVVALAVIAAAAGASGAAQKADEKKPVAQPAPAASAAPTGKAMGYGVKLGGFFTPEHKAVAKRSFAQHFAKTKECPKDMEREGKTCRAQVKGHYWAVGQTVQKAVETFPVPEDVAAKLPPAPEGYEYVRAGEDVLLVSKGLNLVVDGVGCGPRLAPAEPGTIVDEGTRAGRSDARGDRRPDAGVVPTAGLENDGHIAGSFEIHPDSTPSDVDELVPGGP